MTDREALEAAKKIKEYCRNISSCIGCIFDRENCILSDPDHLPETWQLDKEQESEDKR